MLRTLLTTILAAAITATMTLTALAAGADVNATPTGLALRGYDPVAYFTDGKPTPGSWQITARYNDATYRFASDENKAKFVANPEAFVPAYGGYCAFATAQGFKFDGDPNVWKIVDNRLYLNVAPGVKERWEADQSDLIARADVKWPDIANIAPAELK